MLIQRQKNPSLPELLWGEQAKVFYLFAIAFVMLFSFLGAKDIWTQEHRWADIVAGMFYRHDFLHPYLGENRYYDKPLLSYWLIVAMTKVIGNFNSWALRLPSACAGFLSIYAIYQLGCLVRNKALGLLAGWLLLSTYYFVFWARVSSADMLNLAGSLLAILWYYRKRDETTFLNYAIFFIILALTSLCKGLIGAIVPLLAVIVDIALQRQWKKHLHAPLFLAVVPAAIIYIIPFGLSSWFGGEVYGDNGLYLVYRENILRYFQPFDHQGPIYTYLIYLPIYLLPWSLFLIPSLWTFPRRWQGLDTGMKWVGCVLLCVFLFFSLSGSRRSYYVLPMVPFAILLIAEWLLTLKPLSQKYLASFLIFFSVLLFLGLDVFPAWYYTKAGVHRFAYVLKNEVTLKRPWSSYQIVMLDGDTKLNFYLHLPPTIKNFDIKGNRENPTKTLIEQSWPILANKPSNTIFITRKLYAELLRPHFKGYQSLSLAGEESDAPLAFIPQNVD